MEEVQLHNVVAAGGSRSEVVVSPFNRLADEAPSNGHGGHGGGAHTPITTGTKLVFGLGFCIETMFDVASDTLLAKFYAGAVLVVAIPMAWMRAVPVMTP